MCLEYSAKHIDLNGGDPIFPCDIHLSKIKSRTFTALYSREALRKSDIDLIRSVRELDEELECWRISFPESVRPQLSFSRRRFKQKNTYGALTHMNYYCCVNLIHLAGGRCSAWRSDSASVTETLDCLHSSLALSVEASRSLLLFLDDTEAQISAACFWNLLFYPMSAVITIFCNLLRDLHADTVRHDLHLLNIAEMATTRLFVRRNNVFERASDFRPAMESISALREHAQRAIAGEVRIKS